MQSISPLDEGAWEWGGSAPVRESFAGRDCIRLTGEPTLITAEGVTLTDGVLELDLAVTRERSFPGLSWRVQDDENCESFWVRPHQMGNPDAVQYAPDFNGVTSWQLYTGEGFWRAVQFPLDDWFTIRVAFAGDRVQAHVNGEEVIHCTRLRRPVVAGAIGVRFVMGTLRIADLRVESAAPDLPPLPPEPRTPGIVERWEVSEPFAESEIGTHEAKRWTSIDAEPTGLVNLAQLAGIANGNTVYARTTIAATEASRRPIELGFSDRATVFLNGEPLFRGNETNGSRDYRFLGTVGWFDTVYLPLAAGDNELVVAVSEDFGGWGLQARFTH